MHIGGQSTGMTERDRRPAPDPGLLVRLEGATSARITAWPGPIAADLAYGLGFAAWRLRRYPLTREARPATRPAPPRPISGRTASSSKSAGIPAALTPGPAESEPESA